MKTQKILFLMLITILLIFSGCFSSWQEETGTIILNLGGNSRMAFPPTGGEFDEIEYEVIFTGANDEFTVNSKGEEIVKTTVIPGEWKITVKAYYYVSGRESGTTAPERIMYAIGKETVKVKQGQSNSVTVLMSNMGEVEFYISTIKFKEYIEGEEYIFRVTGSRASDGGYGSKDFSSEPLNPGLNRIEIESGLWSFNVFVYNGNDSIAESIRNTVRINPGYNDKIIEFYPVDIP